MSVSARRTNPCPSTLALTHSTKSFSSILSSIGNSGQAATPSVPAAAASKPAQPSQQPRQTTNTANSTNGAKLTPTNTAAGVKRRSEEPVSSLPSKIAKIETGSNVATKPVGSASAGQRPLTPVSLAKPQASQPPRSTAVPNNAAASKPSSAASASSQSATTKRGFAATLAKAQAAQAAAQAAGSSVYKHQTASRILTKRERERLKQEAKLKNKVDRKLGARGSRSRSNTPVAVGKAKQKTAGALELGYKGTMKSAAPAQSEGPVYKGTMKSGPAAQKTSQTSKPPPGRRRQDEYVDWDEMDDMDDMDDGEDQDEGGYESEGSSDMEGGFNDVQREEFLSVRAAKKEDEEAIAEEERHRREKEERRRKLASLSKAAAGKRKY